MASTYPYFCMDSKSVRLLQESKISIIYLKDCIHLNGWLTSYLRESLRLDLLDECIWLLPWLRNAICFEIGFVLNLSSRSKGCSMNESLPENNRLNFRVRTSTFSVTIIQKRSHGTSKFYWNLWWVLSARRDFYSSNYSRARLVLTPWSWIHLYGRSRWILEWVWSKVINLSERNEHLQNSSNAMLLKLKLIKTSIDTLFFYRQYIDCFINALNSSFFFF